MQWGSGQAGTLPSSPGFQSLGPFLCMALPTLWFILTIFVVPFHCFLGIFCFCFYKRELNETGKIKMRNKWENCFYIKDKACILYTTETDTDIF